MERVSSLSKVAVEYHDPSGVFQLISRQLQSHLPLRDLHWKSPTRPLRSIDFLHIDLHPATESDRPGSRHGTAGLEQSPSVQVTGERRHQIPGLRQTPYLKLFLLRCDDNENYKSTKRKELREWLKSHTPASQQSSSKNAQENHDAFEWLIVHVVFPNTIAASQPRNSGSSSKSDHVATEKSGGSSKLLGRGSNTLLEKIRADFNVSSKSAPDRVAQIRLEPDELPVDLIPSRPHSASHDSYQESGQERANAWQDMVSKLKTLILSSFALRVNQYEEDIREREAQRILPGWNFCTFFMLKEGLARGFESVGLIDDALIGYDELSLGLESAMEEGDKDGTTTRSDSFLKYTKEMKDILLQCLTSDSAPDVFWEPGSSIVSATRKDYRNLIVNSNVSLFDFQCYIFARQMSILLRMGTSHTPGRAQLSQDDIVRSSKLAPLGDLCQRGAFFISTATRTLRNELLQAADSQGIDAPISLINDIIASFAYAVAEQILLATNVGQLFEAQEEVNVENYHQTIDRLQHPARRSSLQPRIHTLGSSLPKPVAMLKHLEDKLSKQQVEDEIKLITVGDVGILAGRRAELLFLQRHIAVRIANSRGWAVGMSRLIAGTATRHSFNAAVSTNKGSKQREDPAVKSSSVGDTRGLLIPVLQHALGSKESFSEWYRNITYQTLEQCVLALRVKAVQRLIADLAIINFDAGDFSTAATYLSRVIPSFTEHSWDQIETELTRVHSLCLKKLNRKDEYVRMALNILMKLAFRVKAWSRLHPESQFEPTGNHSSHGLLDDIIMASQELPHETAVPLTHFFTNISVDPNIRHLPAEDGFILKLKVRYLLDDTLVADIVQLKLSSADPPFFEIWLDSTSITTFVRGMNMVEVGAQVSCFGRFTIEKFIIKSKHLSFEAELNKSAGHDPSFLSPQTSAEVASEMVRLPQVLCYANDKCLDIEVKASRDVHIDKIRTVAIILRTGRNAIDTSQLSLKAASAGLRLMVADATTSSGEGTMAKGKAPGILELTHLAAQSTTTILLPYDLESNLARISIGVDFTYSTSTGVYKFLSNPTVVVELALDVSVHDLFRANHLYSRFQIRPSRGIPLLVQSIQLEESDQYAVDEPSCQLMHMLILPQQEGTGLYKIRPKKRDDTKRQSIKSEKPLQLCVTYLPLNDMVTYAVEESLLRALKDSRFGFLSQYLRKEFVQSFHHLSTGTFEEVALLNEIRMLEHYKMGWNELLGGLDPEIQRELEIWLRNWCEKNSSLPLVMPEGSLQASPQQHSHTIRIRVPLPRLHILHTAELSVPASPFVTQGEAISATVSIIHTRRWDSPSSLPSMIHTADNPLDFCLEVDAQPETWLIGGQRRSRFTASEGEERQLKLILVPLKTGRLLLPEVTIRLAGDAGGELRCETDYRSCGNTVLVVAKLRSMDVGLNETANGMSSTLVGSDRRF